MTLLHRSPLFLSLPLTTPNRLPNTSNARRVVCKSLSTTSHVRAREWLEQNRVTKFIASNERKINLRQREEEAKYSKLRLQNVVVALVGLGAGAYVGDAMERRSGDLTLLTRSEQSSTLSAMTNGFGVLAAAFLLELGFAATTAGVHLPLYSIGGACLGCVGFRIGRKILNAAGRGGGGGNVSDIDGKTSND